MFQSGLHTDCSIGFWRHAKAVPIPLFADQADTEYSQLLSPGCAASDNSALFLSSLKTTLFDRGWVGSAPE